MLNRKRQMVNDRLLAHVRLLNDKPEKVVYTCRSLPDGFKKGR